MKLLTAIALSASVAGGGIYLLFRQGLYDGAVLVMGMALGALLIWGLWKRPDTFLGIRDDDLDGEPPVEAVNVIEQELRRKDRGEVRDRQG
jgi:hypothetical protein